MGLATSKEIMLDYGSIINTFDIFVITIFTIEIILRIYVHRLHSSKMVGAYLTLL